MSSTFYLGPGENISVRTPGLCVACGAPVWHAGGDVKEEEAQLPATGSYTVSAGGNQRVTRSISFSFALCGDCASARARARLRAVARKNDYPGHWYAVSLTILAVVAIIGWFIAIENPSAAGDLANGLCGLALVALLSGVLLQNYLQGRFDKEHPPSEDDVRRLALIGNAATVSPNPMGTSITFQNDAFSAAFAAANGGLLPEDRK